MCVKNHMVQLHQIICRTKWNKKHTHEIYEFKGSKIKIQFNWLYILPIFYIKTYVRKIKE